MDRKPGNREHPHALDVMNTAWQRLANNRNDAIEGTFCHRLFEENRFDEALFLALCDDMDLVIEEPCAPKKQYKVLVWIISSTFRCVFSHLDKKDGYKIANFDTELSQKWGADYLERLRNLLEKVIDTVIDAP